MLEHYSPQPVGGRIATQMSSIHDQQIRLNDGRSLCYAEYGAARGRPVFLFHGIPGSRFLRHPDDTIAADLNVRLIVPDRPGMGGSSFRPGRRILDWPADLLELADALRIERFAVAGISGGGPYAAACGYVLADRLEAVGIISGVGPLDAPGALTGMLSANRMGYSVGRWMPWPLWRAIFGQYYGDISRHPERLARVDEQEPEADRNLFSTPGVREIFIENFAAAFRQGTTGVARDGWLLARPWGFDLQAIRAPVYLWQGESDVVVTPAMARCMAERIPGCTARFLTGEGHLLWVTHWREILSALTGRRPAPVTSPHRQSRVQSTAAALRVGTGKALSQVQ